MTPPVLICWACQLPGVAHVPTARGEKQGVVNLGAFCICPECGRFGVYAMVDDALTVVRARPEDWRSVPMRMQIGIVSILLPQIVAAKLQYRQGSRRSQTRTAVPEKPLPETSATGQSGSG